VNLVCDNALLAGYSQDTHLIEATIIRRAISQMLPNFGDGMTDLLADENVNTQELEDGRRL